MQKKKTFGIIIGSLFALTISVGTVSGQYKVSGGAKEPLKVAENTAYKLEVYLVYGMEGVTISHTSSSGLHKWYRYKKKAAVEDEWEAVPSTQNGTTSTVGNLTEGYGYFVHDPNGMKHYVWLIDYSKYLSDINHLKVAESSDLCSGLRLDGEATIPTLSYFLPDGKEAELKREFEVSYLTQKWRESSKMFVEELLIDTIKGNPFSSSLKRPPLSDTKIELTGDLFARHFGVEKSASIDRFEAVALEVHADTIVSSQSSTNLSRKDGELLAPADVAFRAYANTPVASLFVWKIIKKGVEDKPLVRFTEPEMNYTFDTAGEYTVQLEVSDRTGKCINTEKKYTINITETVLKVPNVFTPDGSPGVNDVFKVVHKSVVRFSAWVFNRWGNELYHWTDPNGGWDGKYRGKYVPAGAYYYVIEYTGTDGKTYKKSGDINVVRSTKINSKTP